MPEIGEIKKAREIVAEELRAETRKNTPYVVEVDKQGNIYIIRPDIKRALGKALNRIRNGEMV